MKPLDSVTVVESAPIGQTAYRDLNTQIRPLLLECPSRQQFFQKLLIISRDRFGATIARVDFTVGQTHQTLLCHDPRMARSLAERFNGDYLNGMVNDTQTATPSQPKLKRFERGEQKVTLISAPVSDIRTQQV
ncbi:MAG: hypothetical protein GY758_35670, partial [Fuerstiella sp.]|nr:hypothetical protein [Fuerstiella sp.]